MYTDRIYMRDKYGGRVELTPPPLQLLIEEAEAERSAERARHYYDHAPRYVEVNVDDLPKKKTEDFSNKKVPDGHSGLRGIFKRSLKKNDRDILEGLAKLRASYRKFDYHVVHSNSKETYIKTNLGHSFYVRKEGVVRLLSPRGEEVRSVPEELLFVEDLIKEKGLRTTKPASRSKPSWAR